MYIKCWRMHFIGRSSISNKNLQGITLSTFFQLLDVLMEHTLSLMLTKQVWHHKLFNILVPIANVKQGLLHRTTLKQLQMFCCGVTGYILTLIWYQ